MFCLIKKKIDYDASSFIYKSKCSSLTESVQNPSIDKLIIIYVLGVP